MSQKLRREKRCLPQQYLVVVMVLAYFHLRLPGCLDAHGTKVAGHGLSHLEEPKSCKQEKLAPLLPNTRDLPTPVWLHATSRFESMFSLGR